jgi:hypothetical protein
LAILSLCFGLGAKSFFSVVRIPAMVSVRSNR